MKSVGLPPWCSCCEGTVVDRFLAVTCSFRFNFFLLVVVVVLYVLVLLSVG